MHVHVICTRTPPPQKKKKKTRAHGFCKGSQVIASHVRWMLLEVSSFRNVGRLAQMIHSDFAIQPVEPMGGSFLQSYKNYSFLYIYIIYLLWLFFSWLLLSSSCFPSFLAYLFRYVFLSLFLSDATLSICRSIYLPICLYLSIHLSTVICVSIFLPIFIHISINQSINLSIDLSIYLLLRIFHLSSQLIRKCPSSAARKHQHIC